MPKPEYRDPTRYEVAVYDYASQRIVVSVSYDDAALALEAYAQLLTDNEVPASSAVNIVSALHSSLLRGVTLFDHQCLATNSKASFIVRK